MSLIQVGDEFASYEAVEQKIQELQEKEKFKLWKRDTRTIAAAIKRMPKRVFNPEVKYNELLYCCVYGGREKKDELRSMRQRCPYQIKFRCTQDGQRLRVVSVIPQHNHSATDLPDVDMKEEPFSPTSLKEDSDEVASGGEVEVEDNLDDSFTETFQHQDIILSPDLSFESKTPFTTTPFKQQKLRVILDVDTGIDDSHAILLALAHPKVEVLAITCANGNVNVNLVCENTLRVLQACGREDIPVYRGAECSLLGNTSQFENFSGAAWNTPVDMNLIRKEHASNAMIRIINENPGEVTLVALAPLTNLALAMRLDSTVGRKIKDLYIMGGNLEARGSMSTCAEFNFYNDPEAAQVVLNEFINITILPSEVCRKFLLPWDFFDQWTNGATPVSDFVKRSVLESVKPARLAGRSGYWSCDGYAMAMVVDRSVVQSAEPVFTAVELSGQMTRGQMVVDWDGRLQQPCNALVVKELDIEKVKALFLRMVAPLDIGQEQNNNNSNNLHNTNGYNHSATSTIIQHHSQHNHFLNGRRLNAS